MEKKYSAKNGVAVYSYPNPTLNSFNISLYIKAGYIYESEEERGISHFLEHVLIRNINELMGGTLYPTLDRTGLELGAYTYPEMIQLSVQGARERFSLGGEIITRALLPITLSSSHVDTERRRIKAEIRESDDKNTLSYLASSTVHEGTPLAGSILGTNRTVDRITRTRLEKYRQRVISQENIFFYLTGSYTEEELASFTELVGSFSVSPTECGQIRTTTVPVSANFGRREPTVVVKSSDYTAAHFSFDVDMTRASACELDLIESILFSGFSAPFFVRMSEESGLVYDVSGGIERYRNIATLTFSFEVDSRKLETAIQMCVDILNSFMHKPLSEGECMKAPYVDNAPLLLDSARELNFTFAYENHISGLGYPSVEARRRAYLAVSPEDITRCAGEIFRPENLTLAIKGNKKKIDTERIRNILLRLGE